MMVLETLRQRSAAGECFRYLYFWGHRPRAKFGQNPSLRDFLLGTGDQVLVEASRADAIWGIGLAAGDPCAQDPASWQGLNLLGFALMTVRDALGEQT